MYFHLHFWRLESTLQLFVLHVCIRRLPCSNYLGSFVLPRFTTFCIPLQPWPLHLLQMLRWATRLRPTGRLHLRWRSLQTPGIPPPQTYNDFNYHFNHSTPGNTVYYNPTTVMDQLHITEHQTITAPPLPNNIPYTQLFTAFTLEEYQLLSQQQATPLAQLDYTRPIHCIPGDLRMPHYNSTLLSISLPEAANVHYYHTTSLHATTGDNTNYVIIQLQIEQPLLLRYLTSGQFLHFTRGYISYMMSVQHNYYLPTTTLPQTIFKVNYNMATFTDNYSLRNNVWNFHMPLLLPELLHYLYNRDQLHDYQHKAITTILCKSIQYYGFTLLTMTNLTQHHKALLHRFLRDYEQHMSCPEIDDERLRGAPNYMTNFFTTNYYATLDSRLQKVQDYRTQNWVLHF